MTDVKGGYQRPTTTDWITDSWNGHRNRPTPSTEPGTDYGSAYGSNLFAVEDGTVVDVKTDTSGAMGRFITIDLNDGRRTRSIHLSQVGVTKGTKVKRGQVIGKTGASAWGKEWGVGAHVHQTLWERQAYTFGRDATIDFVPWIGADNDGSPAVSQVVKDRQNYLNAARGERLVVDGIDGIATRDAIKRYQGVMKDRGLYSGALDGIWGDGTQKGHEVLYAEWEKGHAAPSPVFHNVTLDDIASIGDVVGLQKIARLYGYAGGLDNDWGPGSKRGLQKFLDQNYGGSLVGWLRSKWGYVGNEQFGPVMKAALQRASAANNRAL